MNSPDVACDAFWGGRLRVWQPVRGAGYRFNLDPVLLAGFTPPATHIIDLGAGCGIVGLLLLAMGKAQRVTAIERQPQLAELCQRNADDNAFGHRLHVVCADLRACTLPIADAVVFNPPYFPALSGHAAPNPGRDQARHERFGTLADFVHRAVQPIQPHGFLTAIVPTQRASELTQLARQAGAAWEYHRQVVPRRGEPANHLLLQAGWGASASASVPDAAPLIVHAGQDRTFSPEVQGWVSGAFWPDNPLP